MSHWVALSWGLLWCVLVVAGLYGWGAIVTRPFWCKFSAAERTCIGVGFAVFAGGLLDVGGIAVRPVLASFVLIGALRAAIDAFRNRAWEWMPRIPAGWPERCLLVLVVALAAFSILGHVYYPDFNRIDDLPGYLAFPQKLLSTGSLGFEPFSDRRLVTSLGGIYFLQALVLSGTDIFFLHVIDPALGLLLTLGLLESAMARRDVPPVWRLAVLLSAILFVPQVVNLSPVALPAALLLYIYFATELRTREDSPGIGRQRAGWLFALACVGSALVSIKPMFLPAIGGFLAFFYGRRLLLQPRNASNWLEPAILAALIVTMVSPWMLQQWRDTGTAMYPLFGKGFHASQYGTFIDPAKAAPIGDVLAYFLRDGLLYPPFAFAWCAAIVLTGVRRFRPRNARDGSTPELLAWVAVNILSLLIVTLGTGGYGVRRYGLPNEIATLLVVLYHAVRIGSEKNLRIVKWVIGAAAASAPLLILATHAYIVERFYALAVRNVAMALAGPNLRPQSLAAILARGNGAERQSLLRMQSAVPAGETVLERLDYPFLMDFRRNNIFIDDIPGEVSPPPGMPSFKGPEPLADYLLAHSVRYVAYSYADEAGFPLSLRGSLETAPWVQAEAAHAYDFQSNLNALMRTRRLIFDDGRRAVIDLASRR